MALSNIKKTKTARPRRTLLYGVHGIGKSSWANLWPNPVFINLEDGLTDIDADAFPVPQTLQEAWSPIMELASESNAGHGYETLVIDSVDWLEQRFVWSEVANKSGVKHIGDIGFGKGYSQAADIFGKLLRGLDSVRDSGMHVLLLAHSAIKRFDSPDADPYDRYVPKLHQNAAGFGVSSMVQEWADEVLFCNYETFTKSTDAGFGKKSTKAIGNGDRVIYTTERPSHLAKNRLGLPDKIPMALDHFSYGDYIT